MNQARPKLSHLAEKNPDLYYTLLFRGHFLESNAGNLFK